MNPDHAIDFGREAILECMVLAAPALIVALIAAVAIGVMQSMTQVQDQSVSFIPKMILVAITILLCLPWLADHFTDYSRELFRQPQFGMQVTESVAESPKSATKSFIGTRRDRR